MKPSDNLVVELESLNAKKPISKTNKVALLDIFYKQSIIIKTRLQTNKTLSKETTTRLKSQISTIL